MNEGSVLAAHADCPHISDSHVELPAAARQRSRGRPLCAGLSSYVNALDPQPDLVVHGGDVAHDARPEEYAEAMRILRHLDAPLCAIPGNRDRRVPFREAFSGHLPDSCHSGFVQFAIMTGSHCAIMLDSISEETNKGRLCTERLAHFEAMLTDAGDRQVVVFMHHPPFEVTESKYPIQFDDWNEVEAFAGIVERHSNVVKVCCGHSHRIAKGMVGGVEVSTIPSIAEDLRLGPPALMEQVLPVYDVKAWG